MSEKVATCAAIVSAVTAMGYATAGELAARFLVNRVTIRDWARKGLLECSSRSDPRRGYYRLPTGATIVKGYGGPHAKPPQILLAPICHTPEPGAVS